MTKIKCIDLFAGVGGLTEGFMQVGGFNEIAAVEWSKSPVETLRNRLKKKWGIEDAKERVLHFDLERTEELYKGWNDQKYGAGIGLDHLVKSSNGIDLVIGGPPCQAYSVAGRVRDKNGMKYDYRNYLFENYLKIVERYQPKMFVFENVPGILSARPDGELITDKIIEGFSQIGYEVVHDLKKHALLNSKDYNVPQSRKRVIIVGINKNNVKREEDIQDILVEFYQKYLPKFKGKKEITVENAIGDLPKFIPNNDEEILGKNFAYKMKRTEETINWHKPRYHSVRDKEIFNILSKDIQDGNNMYINSKVLSELYEERVGSKSPIHRYHVLRPNKPSTTIIAHLYKDGNRFIHYDPEQSRTITPREAARLQSFPDDFEFIGGQGAVYQMIGNAVPPELGKGIANAIKILFEKYIN